MHVVYGLEDPRDNIIFYVGMTSDMYARFIQHIRCEENNGIKNERIHQLKAIGLLPIPRTLETMHTIKQAKEREQYWIAHYAYLGNPLTNEIRPAMLRRIKEVMGERCSLVIEDNSSVIESVAGNTRLPVSNPQEKMLQVVTLQASGKQKPEIIKTVWGG